jgi:hypothetical protein
MPQENQEQAHSIRNIVETLTALTDSVSKAFDDRSHEHTEIVRQLCELRSDIRAVQNDTKILCTIVRDGNGQPSLIQRLSNLETIVSNHDKEIVDIEKHASSIAASKSLTQSQLVAGVVGMVITGLLAGLSLVAQVVNAKGN